MSAFGKVSWLLSEDLTTGMPARIRKTNWDAISGESEKMAAWTKVGILEGFGKWLRGKNQQDLGIG